jgi:hypothetical protein
MRDRQRVAELESGLVALALAIAALETKLDTFDRENAHLRVVAQGVDCPYGFRAQNGGCLLGYPGCACMDDLIVCTAFSPYDQSTAQERLEARNAALHRRLLTARKRITLAVKSFRSMADGFHLNHEPSKAAGAASMADLLEDPL